METREIASPVGSKAGPRDALIRGERTASSPNSHVSAPLAQDEHPNPVVLQVNSMLLGECQPLRGAQEGFYFRRETDTAHALHQHMRLDNKSMPARPSTIWVNPPKTKEDQAGKLYVILPEMTIPVADILCQNSKMKFSEAVSKKIKANMVSEVRLDASWWERTCRYKNERRLDYRVRSQRGMYEKKLRNWKSEKRPYRRPTLTTVGPTGFIADRSSQYESKGDEQMAIIQFPETIIDKEDLCWGDRGRLVVEWPVAQELLAHAILWLDIQHPVLSDIDAMTTPWETNVDAKNLPIDLVRYFATQNKWIWITKMETGIHDFLDMDRYVIDFRETEFANTARMMYFQKGQTLYLHHLCHPARRERVRGRVPDSLFDGVADNLNLRGKLNSLVQKFRQAVRSGYDSPPHGDLFFVDIFTDNEKMAKAISEVLAEVVEDDIELNYDFTWPTEVPKPVWSPPASTLESLKSLEERQLKANDEPEEDQLDPDSRVFYLCRREIPGIEPWNKPGQKYDDEYRERIQKMASTSSPTAGWTCNVEAACPDCYCRFYKAIDSGRKPPPDLFAPRCSYGADMAQEWERQGELRCNRWDWSKYPNNSHAPSNQPTPVASPLAKKEARKDNRPSGKDLPVESSVAKEGDEETLPMGTPSSFSALVARLQHLKAGRPFGSPPLQNPVKVSSLNRVTPSAPAGAGASFTKVVYTPIVKFKRRISPSSGTISPFSSVDGATEVVAVAGGPTPEEPVNVNPADIPLPIVESVQTDDKNPGSEENINTADLESANNRPREDSGYKSLDLPRPSNTGQSPEYAVSSSLDLGDSRQRGLGKS